MEGLYMIRECKKEDLNALEGYLNAEPYGRAILTAIRRYGLEEKFQTIYINVQPGEELAAEMVSGVYLWLHRNLMLYCSTNQVDIDFLEQMIGEVQPDKVVGRRDNVNIVSWLLTDYQLETGVEIPEILDADGEKITCITEEPAHQGEWAVLNRGEA